MMRCTKFSSRLCWTNTSDITRPVYSSVRVCSCMGCSAGCRGQTSSARS